VATGSSRPITDTGNIPKREFAPATLALRLRYDRSSNSVRYPTYIASRAGQDAIFETYLRRQPMNGPARFLVGTVLLFVVSFQVLAQTGCVPDRPGKNRNGKIICGQPDSGCATNRRGEIVCTTPGGGMRNDLYGELLCGPGYCVTDQRGDAFCSRLARGAASLDQTGNAVCSGGCVPATTEACVRPASKQ
jgi:hypothetical protein